MSDKTILERWRSIAYDQQADRNKLQRFWANYFNIEKGIYEANIGLTPNNNGEMITLVIPELTEERRKEYVKEVKSIAEEAKIALRNIRQEANNEIKKLELPEDEEKRGMDRVQDLINKYNKEVDSLLSVKEKELMTV